VSLLVLDVERRAVRGKVADDVVGHLCGKVLAVWPLSLARLTSTPRSTSTCTALNMSRSVPMSF